MDVKEYLDNYCLGAIDTSSIKPVLISVKQLGIIMNGFYQAKSKEEAEERYKAALQYSNDWGIRLGTTRRGVVKIAAFGKEEG